MSPPRSSMIPAPTRGSAEPLRRSVVPPAAGRSLWLAAVWTGVGAALVGAVTAVVAVAVLWLPVSGGSGQGGSGDSGRAGSVIRAGLITFSASLHGGVTVDGLDAAFLPLGLLFVVGLVCRRAGRGLAHAAAALDETAPSRLVRAGVMQAVSFAVVVAIFATLSTLGTSSASVLGALFAGLVVFGLSGGTALARATPLGESISNAVPPWFAPALRISAVVVVAYVTAGAVLVGASLVVHFRAVETLSGQLGGGWSGLPVLLLGVLAAPNAAIAGAAYLAGPGFAVGSGTTVSLGSSPHGRLPDFPILGALPTGHAAWGAWLLVVTTPLVAGLLAAIIASRAERRWQALAAAVPVTAFAGLVLAWQGGGRIGSAGLHAIGASPWQFGLVTAGVTGVVSAFWLGLGQVVVALRARGLESEPDSRLGSLVASINATVEAAASEIKQASGDHERDGDDRLAG